MDKVAILFLLPTLLVAQTAPKNEVYFPLIKSGDWKTELGLVNPGETTAVYVLEAYASSGAQISTSRQANLPAHGRIFGAIDGFFPGISDENIAWVKARASLQLHGFMVYESTDGQRRMLAPASMVTSSRLFVPHIAEDTENWWTESGLINLETASGTSFTGDGNAYASVPELLDANSGAKLDMTAFFTQGMAPGKGTGRFVAGEPAMAGLEVFGSKSGGTAAALTLGGLPGRTLYFTHVAQDTLAWWTGFAVVNVNDQPTVITVKGYAGNGHLLDRQQISLEANTKKVGQVTSFIDIDPLPAYVIMEATLPVIGFELFGGKTSPVLAGLGADGTSATRLFFNHVSLSDGNWTGVTLINMATERATLQVTGYNEAGQVVATNSTVLAAGEKKAQTAQGLFSTGVGAELTHLVLDSSQPLAGFALVGHSSRPALGGMLASPSAYSAIQQSVNTAGATLTNGQAQAVFPSGALPQSRTITLAERPLDQHLDGGAEPLGNKSYALYPLGLELAVPVTVTLPIDPALVTGKRTSASLAIHSWNPTLETWIPLQSVVSSKDGDAHITASLRTLAAVAILPLPEPKNLSITFRFPQRGPFTEKGAWMVLKKPPKFGVLSIRPTTNYGKYIQYFRNAERGLIDDHTIDIFYIDDLSRLDIHLEDLTENRLDNLWRARRGDDIWCFLIPTESEQVPLTLGRKITFWTISISELEYQNQVPKLVDVLISNQENSFTVLKTENCPPSVAKKALIQKSYFQIKTHYNCVALDRPQSWLTGPDPLLLVHGINGTAAEWGDNLYRLRHEQGKTVWTASLAGCGIENIPTTATLFGQAVDYVSAAHGREIDVVTHSYGGVIARWYCLENNPSGAGDKLDDLVMIAPPQHGSIGSAKVYAEGVFVLTERLGGAGNRTRDVFSPVYQELSPGSSRLMRMGQRPFPQGIRPIIFAGVDFIPLGSLAHTEALKFSDGAVAVGSASLLELNPPVPLAIVRYDHTEQTRSENLMTAVTTWLEHHTILESEVPFYYQNHNDIEIRDHRQDHEWYHPYWSAMIVDLRGENGVESVEIDPEWIWNLGDPDLKKNPDHNVFYTRSTAGFIFGVSLNYGESERSGTVIINLNEETVEQPGVPLNACATTIWRATQTLPPKPVIQTYSAQPDTIREGEGTQLSWCVTGADVVTLSGVDGNFGPIGTYFLAPTTTTVVTLSARGLGGQEDVELTIIVKPAIEPISMSILFDSSGSMSESEFSLEKNAAIRLVSLLTEEDEMSVYNFSSQNYLVQDFTSQRSALIEGIADANYLNGETLLYDSIYEAMEEGRNRENAKIIVALTDGLDTSSSRIPSQLISYAAQTDYRIFVLIFDAGGSKRAGTIAELRQIAERTGGQIYEVAAAADLYQQVDQVYEDSAERELPEQEFEILAFYANRTEAVYGDVVTLSWAVTGAENIQLEPDFGNVADSGSIALPVSETVTYTLTATTDTQSLSRNLTIEAIEPPDLFVDMVWIPPGSFHMGSSQGEGDESPVHHVNISRGFWMARTELTQDQFVAVWGVNPSYFRGQPDSNNRPVEQLSWGEAQEYIDMLNEREGGGYRLPTEAEWEYAARAGSTTEYFFGESAGALGAYAWYNITNGQTHPVGQKSANPWGIYDIYGNVEEWCSDWYDFGYYNQSPPEDPQGPTEGGYRVVRGGDFYFGSHRSRSSFRNRDYPGEYGANRGFRLVWTPPTSAKTADSKERDQ